jgi:uncharacterized membrane protein
MPLHPAIVHVPLGVALAIPFVALWALAVARRSGRLERARWLPVVLLQGIALAGGIAALWTGEADQEQARTVVARAAIHEHHERGETFVWLTGAAFAAGATALVLTAERARELAALASLVLALLAAVGTYYVGHSGGELVYKDGAARAYTEHPKAE